jgi:large subunit ribosomal protein L6
MSRIAKNSIKIDKEISCKFEDGVFVAKGKLGEMNLNIDPLYTLDILEDEIFIKPINEKDKLNPKWGTTRSLVANIITGISIGFSKTLELNGTGYRASISGKILKLQLGYSHDIDYNIPNNVKVECPKQNLIKLTSFNKEALGATAAKIRSYRKPEPFKGKGIKYDDEFIFRKEGKKK